jgi:long-chain acyl-CoA synthetase
MSLPRESDLPLQSAYRWEKARARDPWLTQPMGGAAREWSWQSGMDEARRMAGHLRSLHLPPRSSIAILAKNQAQWVLADLAIWMAGHVSVPLYPTLLESGIQHVLAHSESKLVFVGKLDDATAMRKGIPAALPRIALPLGPEGAGSPWDGIVASTAPARDDPTRPAADLATIVYTSGSTGIPKGVMHCFGAMGAAAAALGRQLRVGPDDRMLSYLPLAHAMERWLGEISALAHGFHVFYPESPQTFLGDLRRARPTVFVSVPRLWVKFQLGVFEKIPQTKVERLLRIPIVSRLVKRKILAGLGLDAVRIAGTGSAPTPPDLIAWYRSLGLELLEGYGMTENFAYSHLSVPGRVRVGYAGNPYPEVQCRIGRDGEIEVKSPGMMMGYYKDAQLSAEMTTADGFLKTGDRGEIDEQGRLKITGRVKEIFKTSKGKYVAPAPIENQLLTSKRIELACVTGSGRPQPYALVQLSERARADLTSGAATKEQTGRELAELRDRVNALLEPHERLEFLAVVEDVWATENGFLTPTMKVRRQAIEDAYAPFETTWYDARQKVVWQRPGGIGRAAPSTA